MPLLLLLKQAWEQREWLLLALLLSLMAIVRQQHGTIAALRGRPSVELKDRIVEKRVVVRGPVRIIKDLVKAPDGTITTRTTIDRAAETVTSDKDREKERIEAPPQVLDALPYRYIGLAATPADYRHPRISAGIALGRHLDVGGYWDSARRLNDGALGAEARAHF